jgi:hypothetical protein
MLLIAMVAAFMAPRAVHAQTGGDARIDRLEATMRAMQAELAQLKAERARDAAKPAPVVNQKKIDEMVTKAMDEKKVGTVPLWVNSIKFFGDLRYRHEQINDDAASEQRDRNRIRARIGLKAKINDEIDAIFRVASGSSDTPTSTNQSLGDEGRDSFSSKDIWLDWAYFDWHPDFTPGLNVYGGKMKQPFYSVGKNELMWDGDLSPEGIVAKYAFDLAENTTATITGGGMWLRERSGDADTSLWGLQGYAKHNLGNGTHLLGGASYYDLGNIKDRSDLSGFSSLNGNTDNGSGGYRYDFNMVEGFVEYGFPIMDMPSAVFASYMENTAAPSKQNEAYFIGARLNKVSSKLGSWQFGYNYREVDPDAVFGGLTDSDVFLGGTGGRGHELGFKYQLHKNVQGALTYFITERDDRSVAGRKDNINLLHADLIFKF